MTVRLMQASHYQKYEKTKNRSSLLRWQKKTNKTKHRRWPWWGGAAAREVEGAWWTYKAKLQCCTVLVLKDNCTAQVQVQHQVFTDHLLGYCCCRWGPATEPWEPETRTWFVYISLWYSTLRWIVMLKWKTHCIFWGVTAVHVIKSSIPVAIVF